MLSLLLFPSTLGHTLGDAIRPDEAKLERRAALLVDAEERGAWRVRTHRVCLLADEEPGGDRRYLSDLVRDLVAFARDTGRVPVVRGVNAEDLEIYAAHGLYADAASIEDGGARYTVRPRGAAGAWARLVSAPRRRAPTAPPVRFEPIRVPLQVTRF